MGTIWLLILFSSIYSARALFEGDACTNFGAPGTCRQFQDCPSALQQLQLYQTFPETCGYEGTVPIVCCSAGSPPTTTTTQRTTTSRTTTTERTRRTTTTQAPTKPKPTKRPEDYAVGELSEEKCAEYGKYVYELVRPSILLPGEIFVNQSVCGFKAVELIVGGTPTKPYEFPHQALLGFQKGEDISWQCGGALISENFVLSAAHCAATAELGNIKYVRLGELDYADNKDDAKPQNFIIAEIIKHPQWKPPVQYYDIMLLRMDKPAVFNRYVRPICLHTTFEIPPTNSQSKSPRFIATGWGRTLYGGDVSTRLLKVVLDSFDHAECSNTYKSVTKRKLPNGVTEKIQLCAGGKDEDKDTCQGDSGGPLQIYSKKVYCMYELVGITSFGKACGIRLVPGVYTRVSNYIDWIEKIVWKNIK